MANWNEGIIEEFRANEGKVGGYFDCGTVLLLHTTGRRTGKDHVTPVVYLPDGDRWVVVGSKGGAPADPDWVRTGEVAPLGDDRGGHRQGPRTRHGDLALEVRTGTTSTPDRSCGGRASRSTS